MKVSASIIAGALAIGISAPVFAAAKDRLLEQAIAADTAWLLAYNDRNGAAFDRVWSDDALLVTTDGRIKTKAEERRDVVSPTLPPEVGNIAYKVSGQQGRRYGSTAVVIGRFANTGLYNGQPFERVWRYTNVYTQRNGRWHLVSSQFAPIGAPAAVPQK